MKDDATQYWDKFYKEKRLGVEDIPSQFSAFVLGEFGRTENVSLIDIGCGNGRDTFFFAKHLSRVIGIDGSSSAIEFCERKNDHKGLSNLKFLNLDITGDISFNEVSNEINSSDGLVIIYARFFLHAIDKKSEKHFFSMAKEAYRKGGVIAVEFRTHKDSEQKKETGSHYRRYIDPLDFITSAQEFGLVLSYFTEGFGYAKYKDDDAHVARFIFKASQ